MESVVLSVPFAVRISPDLKYNKFPISNDYVIMKMWNQCYNNCEKNHLDFYWVHRQLFIV